MSRFDFTPYRRSFVGFDRVFDALENANAHVSDNYPPFNIERIDANAYRITIAVAGFSEDELTIEAREATLTVKGEKKPEAEDSGREVLYRGIAARAFERRFQLADHVEVKGASLEHGLLHVDLVRDIPESKRARTIPIGKGEAAPQIEATLN